MGCCNSTPTYTTAETLPIIPTVSASPILSTVSASPIIATASAPLLAKEEDEEERMHLDGDVVLSGWGEQHRVALRGDIFVKFGDEGEVQGLTQEAAATQAVTAVLSRIGCRTSLATVPAVAWFRTRAECPGQRAVVELGLHRFVGKTLYNYITEMGSTCPLPIVQYTVLCVARTLRAIHAVYPGARHGDLHANNVMIRVGEQNVSAAIVDWEFFDPGDTPELRADAAGTASDIVRLLQTMCRFPHIKQWCDLVMPRIAVLTPHKVHMWSLTRGGHVTNVLQWTAMHGATWDDILARLQETCQH